MNSDSAVPCLNRDIALSIEVKLPAVDKILEFEMIAEPIFAKLSKKSIKNLHTRKPTRGFVAKVDEWGYEDEKLTVNNMRTQQLVITDIKKLMKEKGYIYALCMIIFEDFHINPETMQGINYSARLSIKEASLLLGFLIQERIDFSTPATLQDLIRLRRKTEELMKELHESCMLPIAEKIQNFSEKEHKIEDSREAQKEFSGKGDVLTEAIFYSGDGVYNFQYLDFLERKYKYDRDWLSENKNFDIGKSKNIITQIVDILQRKSKRVHLCELKEKMPLFIENMKKEYPDGGWEERVKESLPMMELSQYKDLFFGHATDKENLSMDTIKEEHCQSFYKSLIELFVIKKTDFNRDSGIDSFLDNFSISPGESCNPQFKTIGDFNSIDAKPIIQLDKERYFVPICFLVFKSVYESPFYWMWEDISYRNQLSQNRGTTGEEITYDFLSQVFGKERTYGSVKISTKKGHHDTDIDVLCILGSKALCVQVKSKKLTQLSRRGDDEQLQKDFQGAVQDAYEQGLVSRHKILERNAKFLDKDGNAIDLSEGIDEVYIVGITTEHYPSLTHQSHVMLDKKDDDPFPIFFTIFDLELIVHYLCDPYDFLYYIRQRISLMDYFIAEEEIHFLGYHLCYKLWRRPSVSLVIIDKSSGALIDRNYYPFKAGLEVSDEGDVIKTRWKNENLVRLCNKLKTLDQPKVTDIIFHLLDWSGEAGKSLADSIIQTKQKSLQDGEIYNFSVLSDNKYSSRVGVTYISLNSDSLEELENKLLPWCQIKKYKIRGDVWIGFGSLKRSTEIIDAVAFDDQKWEYNQILEELSKNMKGEEQAEWIRVDKTGKSFF